MPRGKFIKDVPEFMEWFDPILNPDLDISTLHVGDHKNRIFYMRKDGEIGSTTASTFLRNLKEHGTYIEPRVNISYPLPPRKLAMEESVFLEWFDTTLNPNIDLSKLYCSDDKITILYKRKDDKIGTMTAKSFFRNVKRNNGCFVEARTLVSHKTFFAIDDPTFRNWYNPEINSDIDIEKVSKWNTKQKVKYVGSDNKIYDIHVNAFFYNINRNDGIFVEPNHSGNNSNRKKSLKKIYKTPWKCPIFRDWFNQELNPEIDPIQLTFSSKMEIRYIVNKYTHSFMTVEQFFRNVNKHNGVFRPRKDNIILKKIFMEWFDPELNPTIDPFLIKMADRNVRLKYKDFSGNTCEISINGFFCNARKHGKFMPPVKVIDDFNNAATLDPELLLFWDEKRNKKDPSEISPNTSHEYYFICPYCGYEFTKQIKNIAGKSPKCPQCHDEKKQKKIKGRPSDVAFLLRSLAPSEE